MLTRRDDARSQNNELLKTTDNSKQLIPLSSLSAKQIAKMLHERTGSKFVAVSCDIRSERRNRDLFPIAAVGIARSWA